MHKFDFKQKGIYGLFIAAGGFEDRAVAFINRASPENVSIEQAILIGYEPFKKENQEKLAELQNRVSQFTDNIRVITAKVNSPDVFLKKLVEKTQLASVELSNKSAIIDVSGMAHVLICCTLRAMDVSSFQTSLAYTEAKDYYPKELEWETVIRAVQNNDFKKMLQYLPSSGLEDIQIPTEFKGNSRPGYKTCLFVLPGYEPTRVKGLLDDYSPGAIIVIYGRSPHKRLERREELSIKLHRDVFGHWPNKEIFRVSTLLINKILKVLEDQYEMLRSKYDVAVASQCSKMQTVASYLFWRKYPEVQLVFTTPVKVYPYRCSTGSGTTFRFELPIGAF